MSIGKGIRTGGKAIILIIFSVFTIFPFIWMIISALKTKQEIMDVSSFFPETFQWQNFISVFTDSPLMRYVGNSLYISVFTLLIQIITGAMIAYAIVFLTFKGRGILFGIIMCTYMVPTAATYIPSYIILSDMKLLDTFTGLIISNCVSIFGIFLLRQAFMQVPKGLVEAARIDGGSHWKILWKVVCPITKSSFITFGLMNFISCYNNYMWPSLITDSDSKMMVSQGLRKFFIEGGAYGTEWALVMAGSTLIVLPLLILFAFTQKWFISGIGGDTGTLETLGAALSAIRSVASYSSDLEKLLGDAEDIYYRLQDVDSSLISMADSMSFEPGEIDGCISRIDLIDNLRKKYGSTIEEILAYRDKISSELDVIENFDEEKSKLAAATEAAKADLLSKASALSKARHEAASNLTARITRELSELNFSDAKVETAFTPLDAAGPDGDEAAEFLISANRGEPLKPLAKTASGGEMSRIMLAIRNITGETDRIPTLIFDEIDAGISGVTASVVGRKLKRISESHQIICITHLPQSAAMGDTGYRIYKEEGKC